LPAARPAGVVNGQPAEHARGPGQADNPTCADDGRVRARVHDRTSARGHRRPEQPKAGRPPIGRDATRTTHRPPHRAVGRRCRRDPLSPAPARRRVPGVWLGWVRPRAGPAVSGAVSGGWAPRARYLGCLLCRRPPRGEGDQPLLGLRSSRTPPQRRLRAPRKVPRLPPSSASVPCLALLPHHLFGETPQPRKRRRKNALAVFGSTMLPAAVVVLVRRGASRPVAVGAVL